MTENTIITDTEELWRAIPGFDGYEASNCGRVRSFWIKGGNTPQKTHTPTILKPTRHSISSGGHYFLTLSYWNNGSRQRKAVGVHNAVLMAFVGPRPDGMETRHLDGVTKNNRLDNLVYGTHTENMQDKKIHGTELIGSRAVSAKLTESIVLEIRAKYALGNITQRQLAEEYGVGHTAIGELLLNNHWKHVETIEPDIEPFDPEPEPTDCTPEEFSLNGIEIWRHIPGFHGYQVSNLGRVRSRWAKGIRPRVLGPRWWIMKQTPVYSKHGDLINLLVRLCPPNEISLSHSVRALVALAFMGETPSGNVISHKDGDRRNCRLYNLYYSSLKDIIHSASKRGAYIKNRSTILTPEQVIEIRRRKLLGEVQLRLSEEYGVSPQLISDIVRGRSWKRLL